MAIGLSMNVVNIVLNWALIYGHWGLPQMGMMGSAYATLIARFGMAIVMLLYLYFTPLKVYIAHLGKLVFSANIFWEILKTGFPIGAQFSLEVGAFIAGSIMVGTISHQALAAHQVAISLAAFTYLMASGIGTGATIVISNLMGKKEVADIKTAGRASFLLVLAFMSVCACFFLLFRHQLPGYFNTEPEVMAIATSLLAIAAFFQLSDGLQVTVIGALRGMGDVVAPTWIALFSYWGLTLPISYYCAFHLNLGPVGVWIGYLSGLTIAAILLFLRFRYKLTKLEFHAI
jgi:MATE family multidrug resistance protein